MITTEDAQRANTVHIPGAPRPAEQAATYVASRRFLHAATDEDYAMAFWTGPRRDTRAQATEDLVDHLMSEATSILTMRRSGHANAPSENMVERALELAQLAGAIGTTVASEQHLEQVTSSIGVTYAVRRLKPTV